MDEQFSTHPKSAFWVYEKNGTTIPEHIKCKNQSQKFWFKCPTCNHEFDTKVRSITTGSWCGFCGNKRLCKRNDCLICFDKSFASSDKAIYWSNKNKVNPRDVYKSCNKKFLFDCQCGLEISVSLNNISNGNRWCKKCGRDRSSEKQSLKLNEFISRSTEMHGDRYDYSEAVMNGVDRDVTIICKLHGKFNQTPWKHYAEGHGCHKCAQHDRTMNRRYTFEEFIEMTKKVHEEGLYDYSKAKDVYVHMNHPIPIICKLHGVFTQLPSVHVGQGCGCPNCINKTAGKLRVYLEKSFKVILELTPKWCPSPKSYFKYDFYIEDLGLIVELDGVQHFKKVRNWTHSGQAIMKRDVYKMRCANNNGIRVIRILQQDVWDNDESWLDTKLKPLLIKKDANENEYIGDMYEQHKTMMESNIEIDPSEFYEEEDN